MGGLFRLLMNVDQGNVYRGVRNAVLCFGVALAAFIGIIAIGEFALLSWLLSSYDAFSAILTMLFIHLIVFVVFLFLGRSLAGTAKKTFQQKMMVASVAGAAPMALRALTHKASATAIMAAAGVTGVLYFLGSKLRRSDPPQA